MHIACFTCSDLKDHHRMDIDHGLAPGPWSAMRQLIVAYWRHMATEIWVNIGSGNGLLPDGTKPLPEPMFTYHKYGPLTFIWGQFHKRYLSHWPQKSAWKLLPGASELMAQYGTVCFSQPHLPHQGSQISSLYCLFTSSWPAVWISKESEIGFQGVFPKHLWVTRFKSS